MANETLEMRKEDTALFAASDLQNFQNSWSEVQGSFVDEPRQAVEKADRLVDSMIQRIAESFANERTRLEESWSRGSEVSTEDLRQALRRYRAFFDRLLATDSGNSR